MEDRDRIAAELRGNVIQRIFAAGLTLQGAVNLTTEAEARRRIGIAAGELDEVVRMLRDAVFGLEHRPRRGGLRQEVLELCSRLSPVPEISFSGHADNALSAEAHDRLLELLGEALGLIKPYAVPGRVEITADADSCLVVIDAAARERPAEQTSPEPDFAGLLDRATPAGVRIDIQTTPDGIRLSWQFPLSLSVRPLAADLDPWVPKPRPRHAARRIFVDLVTDASVSSAAVLLKIDRFGQRLQRRGAVQGAAWKEDLSARLGAA